MLKQSEKVSKKRTRRLRSRSWWFEAPISNFLAARLRRRPIHALAANVFDQERLVAALIKMTGPSVSLGVPICITGQPMLHAACQIWLGSLEQGVDMLWHPAVGEKRLHGGRYDHLLRRTEFVGDETWHFPFVAVRLTMTASLQHPNTRPDPSGSSACDTRAEHGGRELAPAVTRGHHRSRAVDPPHQHPSYKSNRKSEKAVAVKKHCKRQGGSDEKTSKQGRCKAT